MKWLNVCQVLTTELAQRKRRKVFANMTVIMPLLILSPLQGSFFIPQILPEDLFVAGPCASAGIQWQSQSLL